MLKAKICIVKRHARLLSLMPHGVSARQGRIRAFAGGMAACKKSVPFSCIVIEDEFAKDFDVSSGDYLARFEDVVRQNPQMFPLLSKYYH